MLTPDGNSRSQRRPTRGFSANSLMTRTKDQWTLAVDPSTLVRSVLARAPGTQVAVLAHLSSVEEVESVPPRGSREPVHPARFLCCSFAGVCRLDSCDRKRVEGRESNVALPTRVPKPQGCSSGDVSMGVHLVAMPPRPGSCPRSGHRRARGGRPVGTVAFMQSRVV